MKKCCPTDCYFKLVEHRLPAFPDAGAGTLTYDYYSDDDPNVAGYAPVVQQGPVLVPYTNDRCVSTTVTSQDGIPMRGSAGATNYFHSAINAGFDPARQWSFEFAQHKCCVISKVYVYGTDLDVGESYDASQLDANWVPAPENTVPESGGVYAATAANQLFVLEWDVTANGLPPASTLSGLSTTGQSVIVYLADYYVPLRTEGCGANLKHYDCDGEYTGDVFTAEEIGTECCGDCPEPRFPMAPPNCLTDETRAIYKMSDPVPGVIDREWHNTKPSIPIANSTTAAGRDFRLCHDFSLPIDTQTVNPNINLNDTDNTAGELDIQVVDTYITVPAGGVWIQYAGGSEGYWAIEVGECCGPLQLRAELGYADREDASSIVGPVFLPEGQHAWRGWNIDSGGTNSSHNAQYSTDGTNFAAAIPSGVLFSQVKRELLCEEIPLCLPVPEDWSVCPPKTCTPSVIDPLPTPSIIIPEQEICVGPFVDQTARTGWLETWNDPANTNLATVTTDWINLSTQRTSPPCLTDVHVSVDFGVLYYQLRRMRMYQWVSWRLLVNGGAVITETLDEYNYRSQREDTNPDVIRPLDVRSMTMGHSNGVRLNIPPASAMQVQVQYSYNFSGAQTSAYGRLIQGLRSQATFVYTPKQIVIGRLP